MRETLGAIAGAVLAYASFAFVIGDLNAMAWTQDARFYCLLVVFAFSAGGAAIADLTRGR